MKRLLPIHKPLQRAAALLLSAATFLLPMAATAPSAHAADEQKSVSAKEITLYRWQRVKSVDDLNLAAGGSTQVMMLISGKEDDHLGSILDLSRAATADSSYGFKSNTWEYWQYSSPDGTAKRVYQSTSRNNENSHDTVKSYSVESDKISGMEVTDRNIDTDKDVFYTDRDYPTMFIKSVGVDFDQSRAVFKNGTITIEPSYRNTTYYDPDNKCYAFALGIGDGNGGDTGWYLNGSKQRLHVAPVSSNTGVYMWEQSKTGVFQGEGQRPWSMKFFGDTVGLFINVDGAKDNAIQSGDYGELRYKWGWSDGNLNKFILYKRTALRMSALDGDLTVKSGAPMQSKDNLYLRPGKTITVEDGAVFTVRGVLYLDGKIEVKKGGTLILQEGACIQPLGRSNVSTGESPGDSIILDGGNMILLKNSKMLVGVFGKGIQTQGGASILNCGTIIQAASTTWNGLSLENRENGTLIFGRSINTAYLSSFYESVLSSSGTFDGYYNRGTSTYFDGDSAVANEGRVIISAGSYCSGVTW